MDRRTNIINDDEVARAMAVASQTKGKRSKQKAPAVSAAVSTKSKKAPSVPAARKRANADTAAPPIQDPRDRFYEANGLKIPLYDQDGMGNKKKQHARLAKSLLNKTVDDLLDIVEQYAGAGKRKEFQDKRLSKLNIATWIEEKETLALGRNPRSTLPDTAQNKARPSNNGVVPPNIVVTTPRRIVRGPPTVPFAPSNKKPESHTPPPTPPSDDVSNPLSNRKRRSYDEPDEQKHRKHQKHNPRASSVAVHQEHPAIEGGIGKPSKNVAQAPQTPAESSTHETATDDSFIYDTELDASDLDHSTVVVRGRGQSQVLTATINPRTGVLYFFDTTVPHKTTTPPRPQTPVPFLKEGKHGRHGDYIKDPDRRTGRGHQVVPAELRLWDEFTESQSRLRRAASGESADTAAKQTWNEWQMWYSRFVEKYPGYGVAHLWPCGCEKVSEDSGSESDED